MMESLTGAKNWDVPLVSIVTPSYNMARYLPETIDSVLGQNYPNLEYLVVDGGSTDGSLEILKRYGHRLRFTSAPDRGPSDAVYKGFRAASGEILGWVNADDTLLSGAIHTAVRYLIDSPKTDVIYGEGRWIAEDGSFIGRYPSLPFDAKILERNCFICQPAAFFRASAYRNCPLDPEVNISFDYDLWIRMAKAGVTFQFVPEYMANSRIHSGSKTVYERTKVFHASMGMLKRHYGYVPLPWIVGYTCFRLDGRDQVLQPMQLSIWKYLASFPVGLWYNPRAPLRFLREWVYQPFDTVRRRRRS